jgi:8-oxo-dGTP diphosphatase
MTTDRAPESLAVVGAVFTYVTASDGIPRVLAFRRGPDKIAAGLWEFAGGKIEPGETAEQAIVREIREEIAIEVTVDEEVLTATTVVHDRTVTITCFHVSAVDALPTSSTDHDELRWMPISELHTLSWIAPDLPVVAALQDRHR